MNWNYKLFLELCTTVMFNTHTIGPYLKGISYTKSQVIDKEITVIVLHLTSALEVVSHRLLGVQA